MIIQNNHPKHNDETVWKQGEKKGFTNENNTKLKILFLKLIIHHQTHTHLILVNQVKFIITGKIYY